MADLGKKNICGLFFFKILSPTGKKNLVDCSCLLAITKYICFLASFRGVRQIMYLLGVCNDTASHLSPPPAHHAALWQKQHKAPVAPLPLNNTEIKEHHLFENSNRTSCFEHLPAACFVLPEMTSAVQEPFTLSQCRTLLLFSLTADHSTTKPLTVRPAGTFQLTSKLLSSSGVAVIWGGAGSSGHRDSQNKHLNKSK